MFLGKSRKRTNFQVLKLNLLSYWGKRIEILRRCYKKTLNIKEAGTEEQDKR
jgi:hypothetical protein